MVPPNEDRGGLRRMGFETNGAMGAGVGMSAWSGLAWLRDAPGAKLRSATARHRPVIVAMVAVPMMQRATNDVIGVRTVGHRRMAAVGTMVVLVVVAQAKSHGQTRAVSHVPRGQGVLVDVVAVVVVQVAAMQVVGVLAVGNGQVTAAGAVDMMVLRVHVAIGHWTPHEGAQG